MASADAPHERALPATMGADERARLTLRLRSRSVRTDDGCLVWQGSRMANGYGRISVRNRTMYAHRAALLAATGELAPGTLALHSCDNPSCVEPSHLRAGSPGENTQDARERGRWQPVAVAYGSRNGQARLDADVVRKVRSRVGAGETRAAVARDVGVSRQTVGDIVARRLWAHVE